jgi:glutaredoxin 3
MIEIYSTAQCPYCDRAKAIFKHKGLTYVEYRIDQDAEKRQEMLTRSQRRTVPQIFINQHHVGGFDDLKALIDAGKFEALFK